MFGRTSALTNNEIETSMTARPRLERGTGKDFLKNMSEATRPLKLSFGIKQQLVQNSREVEEGNIVTTNIAEIFITNGLVNTELIERINVWDMRSAILIPTVVDTTATTPSSGKWGGTVSDMTKEIASTDLSTIKEFVADILTYDEDGDQGLARMDQKWLLLLLRGSCTSDLLKLVDEKFMLLDTKYRGGSVFLKLMYDVIFQMTTQVRRVLQNWIKNFGRKGLLKVEGENVRSIYNAGECIITRLHEVNALPGDADVDILHGLTLATNKTFTAPFLTLEALHNQTIISLGSLSTKTTYEKCIAYLTQALDSWITHVVEGTWTIGHRNHSAHACWNCGDAHNLGDCPKQRDQARIDRAKTEYNKSTPRNTDRRGGGGAKNYSRGKFDRPKPGESVRNINGTWHAPCKSCDGWTTTHSSSFHASWAKDKSGFTLSDNHPLSLAKNGTPPGTGAPRTAVSKNGESSRTPRTAKPTPTQPSTTTTVTMLSALSEHLGQMELEASDPEQAHLASLLKSLFQGKV